ncbi:MAG: TrkA C-terminal domain-containing protein [Clostridia bacterium]|nr:TrkA C-terminal domain-containing protein [Clostridia bacterium]
MNIYVAASLFALLILVYWVISELFTILYRFVGLPEEKARFQVTSLLTGIGFTTRESEMVLSTKRRRRLARITMLFGYVFNITVVSAFVNVFLSLKVAQVGGYIMSILLPLAAIGLIIVTVRVPAVRNALDTILSRFIGKIVHDGASNSIMLIDHIGKGAIAQVVLREVPETLDGVELAASGLKEKQHVLVMLVEHKDGSVEGPGAHTVFVKNDRLTVFGEYKALCAAFNASERFA